MSWLVISPIFTLDNQESGKKTWTYVKPNYCSYTSSTKIGTPVIKMWPYLKELLFSTFKMFNLREKWYVNLWVLIEDCKVWIHGYKAWYILQLYLQYNYIISSLLSMIVNKDAWSLMLGKRKEDGASVSRFGVWSWDHEGERRGRQKNGPWCRWIDQEDWPGCMLSLGRTWQMISHND